MNRINKKNVIISYVIHSIQHYNPKSYWKMREYVIDTNNAGIIKKIIKLWYLFRIKRMDAFNNASMGTDIGFGAKFKTPPHLQHGLNGIIVSHYASIGKNAWIAQQVTIGQAIDKNRAPQIGDNVIIGANAVVVDDIPDNCVVGGIPARIIKMK